MNVKALVLTGVCIVVLSVTLVSVAVVVTYSNLRNKERSQRLAKKTLPQKEESSITKGIVPSPAGKRRATIGKYIEQDPHESKSNAAESLDAPRGQATCFDSTETMDLASSLLHRAREQQVACSDATGSVHLVHSRPSRAHRHRHYNSCGCSRHLPKPKTAEYQVVEVAETQPPAAPPRSPTFLGGFKTDMARGRVKLSSPRTIEGKHYTCYTIPEVYAMRKDLQELDCEVAIVLPDPGTEQSLDGLIDFCVTDGVKLH